MTLSVKSTLISRQRRNVSFARKFRASKFFDAKCPIGEIGFYKKRFSLPLKNFPLHPYYPLGHFRCKWDIL
jgi:hypothetical protein